VILVDGSLPRRTRRGNGASVSDLKVDYDLLEASHKALTSLISEFGNLQASTSGYDGALGSGTIAGAMSNFAGN